jgi:ATP-binding protein involved in chromosome partitioning
MSPDPRPAVIARRFAEVGRVIGVSGGKGGIGKTCVAAGTALSLAQRGAAVGLLDLDFTGPCAHLALGIEPRLPQEDFGVTPLKAAGLHFMSIACFSGQEPTPLRGTALSDALIELLCIVRWGRLDCLVIDMPPGLGDMLLDTSRLVPGLEYLLVSTSSRLSVETVRRNLALLQQIGVPIIGLLENMQHHPNPAVKSLALSANLPFLGALPFDPSLEAALGDPAALIATPALQALDVALADADICP